MYVDMYIYIYFEFRLETDIINQDFRCFTQPRREDII